MNKQLAKQLHQALPQTQCQMCGYKDCQAYANAIAENQESIDLCAPGGEEVLLDLAKITQHNAKDHLEAVKQNYRPPQTMHIQQQECIGCTKCIQVCPVDAIIGTGKHRHDILTDICNGCELCIPACPVDCIDIIPLEVNRDDFRKKHQQQGKKRYANRLNRLKNLKTNIDTSTETGSQRHKIAARQAEIKKLMQRVKNRK